MARNHKKQPGVEASVIERLTHACRQIGLELEDVRAGKKGEPSVKELELIFKRVVNLNPEYVLTGVGAPIRSTVRSKRLKDYSGINNRIRKFRMSLDLTQEEFGKIFGLARTTIASIEQGKQTINFAMLRILNEKYSISYSYIIDGETKERETTQSLREKMKELEAQYNECLQDKKALRNALNRHQG